MKTETTMLQAVEAIKRAQLRKFIGPQQLEVMGDSCRGEEGEYFRAEFVRLAALIEGMPKTGEQNGKGEQAIVYLHYFTGGCDWYITEKDVGTEDETDQVQAFGLADLFQDGGEVGYISIEELLECGAELDLYFEPRTLADVRKKSKPVEIMPGIVAIKVRPTFEFFEQVEQVLMKI